ncbi:mCG146089, partial [Mus musculus]
RGPRGASWVKSGRAAPGSSREEPRIAIEINFRPKSNTTLFPWNSTYYTVCAQRLL